MSNFAILKKYFKIPKSDFMNLDYKPEFLDGLSKSSRFDFVHNNTTIVHDMLDFTNIKSKNDLIYAAAVAGAVDYADDGVTPDLILDPSLKNVVLFGYPYMDEDITIKDPSLQNITIEHPKEHMELPISIRDPQMVSVVNKDLPPTIMTSDDKIVIQFLKDLEDPSRTKDLNYEKILKPNYLDKDKISVLTRTILNKSIYEKHLNILSKDKACKMSTSIVKLIDNIKNVDNKKILSSIKGYLDVLCAF